MARTGTEQIDSAGPSSEGDIDCKLPDAMLDTSDSQPEPRLLGDTASASHSLEVDGATVGARPSADGTEASAPHRTLCVETSGDRQGGHPRSTHPQLHTVVYSSGRLTQDQFGSAETFDCRSYADPLAVP